MKLFKYETTYEMRTEGYIIAPDKEAAQADAEELSDVGDRSIWESDFGPDVYLQEVDPSALRKGDYIWNGGAQGADVTIEKAIQILQEAQDNERPPEIPGQEAFEVGEGV